MWLRIQNISLVIDICDVFSQPNHERTPVEEMKEAEEQGSFTFVHGPSQDEVDEEEFEEAPDTTEPVKVTLHGPVTTVSVGSSDLIKHSTVQWPSSVGEFLIINLFTLKSWILVVTQEPSPAPQKKATPPPDPLPSKTEMDDLEKELELDLENMNLDNVDTSVSAISSKYLW